jgi:hypothetical protein
LLSGISIKNDSKGKAKLTIPHPFCKCGRLIKGDIVKSGAIITSDFLKMPAIEYSAVYLESIF